MDPLRTHNLGTLLDLLPPDVPAPRAIEEVFDLSRYATVTRYPGSHEPITEAHYREALRLAEAVVQWAAELIGV